MEAFWPIVERAKLKVDYNEHFQPVGPHAPKLANVIGTLVKGKVLSLTHEDWTDVKNKDDVWDNVMRYFDLDECLKDYVMRSAHKKWKDFKNRLKTKYFDPAKTDKELWKKHDSRISLQDWKWLIAFWRSEKGQARSNRGKANRAKMAAVHTIGTRSLANVRHDMEQKKGGKVSRAEVFKVAYTRKGGRPQPARQETLAKIDEKLTEEAEFVDKPIQEGDFLSELIGKENRGRVIGVGMGPTPASLGLPGTKSTARINLQLEREARQRAEDEARALRDEMQQLEQRMEERMEQRLVEKLAEFKAMISDSAEQRHNLHIPNEEHSCTSASNNVQPRTAGALQHNKNKLLEKDSLRRVGGRYYAQGLEEHVGNHNSTKPPRIANNHSQARTGNKATSKCSNVPATTTTVIVEGVQKQVANYYSGRPAGTGGANKGKGEHSRVKKAATTTIQVGNDVFLKRIVRPYNRVAKATVESQDPLEMVGGTVLGNECYKVVVDSPIFGDAELFCPFKNLNYIKDAIGHSIAWPIHLVEEVRPPRQNGEVIKTDLAAFMDELNWLLA